MNIPLIIPGAVASTDKSLNVESTVGEHFERGDFSNLLESVVGAAPQANLSAESAGDAMVDSAPSVIDNHQVAQEPDEGALDPSAMVAFIAPFSPTLATIVGTEPTTPVTSETAAIAAAPFTQAVKIDTDQAEKGDSGNYQPVDATQFSPPAAAAALVQALDDKIDRKLFAHEVGQPEDDDGAGLEAKASVIEDAAATPQTKPADVLDSVAPTNDAPTAAPREFKSSANERGVKPAERQTVNDSESFALESPAIEEKTPRLRLSADSQSSFANEREESSADHSQLKPREMAVDRPDDPPQRLVALPTDVAATKLIQENVASENAGEPAWQPVVRQVSEEIVRQARIGEQQAVIELEPPELGKIKIDLRVDGEQIHARIVAEEQSTKALIESRLTELRQALEVRQVDLANLQVEQQNVSSGGGQWGQALSDGSRQGRGPWQDDSGFADRSANDAAQRENSQTPASDPGRISMWA